MQFSFFPSQGFHLNRSDTKAREWYFTNTAQSAKLQQGEKFNHWRSGRFFVVKLPVSWHLKPIFTVTNNTGLRLFHHTFCCTRVLKWRRAYFGRSCGPSAIAAPNKLLRWRCSVEQDASVWVHMQIRDKVLWLLFWMVLLVVLSSRSISIKENASIKPESMFITLFFFVDRFLYAACLLFSE